MSRCVRSFVLFFFVFFAGQLAAVVFCGSPDGSPAQQGNETSDYYAPCPLSTDVDGAVSDDGLLAQQQDRRMASGGGGSAASSPSSRASSPSPARLMNIPTLKEVSDPNANSRRPRRNVTLLPILALLDLSSMENNRGQMDSSGFDGTSLLKTARLAVAHVNARQLIPGFHLQLLVNDSKCDSGAGVDAFFHAIYTTKDPPVSLVSTSSSSTSSLLSGISGNKTRTKSSASTTTAGRPFVMLLGPHCSHVTESVASVTSYWNIVQISHAATSAGLSDRQKFPFFFRTVAVESAHNAARLAFLRHFRWDSVSFLVQNEDDYSLVINDLSALLEDANTSVSNSLTFAPDELTDTLEILQARDARIIIGSFAPSMALPIFCEVHRRNLYGADHVWILPGSVFGSDRWLEQLQQQHSTESANGTSCNSRFTKKDLMAVIEGNFFVRPYRHPVNITDGFFPSFQIPTIVGDEFHGEIYDAIWTMALALRELQSDYLRQPAKERPSLANFNYARKDMAEQLMAKISSLRFQGASGLVSFSGADRIGTTSLFQIQKGVARQIGLFHPDLGLELNGSWPVLWPLGQPPVATRIIKYRIDTIAPTAFYTMTLLASLGIVFALICLSFNLVKRKLKYIKLSSPKLNNMAIVGSCLIYGAVILLGVDHATLVHDSGFPFVCMGRAYFLSAGFSLAFGAMFTKTFRVHRIFSMRNSLLKNKLLADKQLIGLILVLLLMDTLVIGLWVALDPFERHLYNLVRVVSSLDRSVVYQPQVEVCRSNRSSMWLGILYVKKGLLLVAGVYMAWETRKVAIPALNDSPYIGMNVYNVVLTSLIVVFCDSLLSDRTTINYLVVATLILTSTTTALCLLFLPKFHAVWRQTRDGVPIDPICHGTGLKLEFNTRRMVVDDRKELLTRAEIMNRVYLRDIAKLDAEIQRLDRILAKEFNSSVSTLDDYSSAIQAEVTQLYAMLEQDQDPAGAVRIPSGTTWDLPRYFNKLISRSCVSLGDSRQVNATLTTNRGRRKCSTAVGWGSASCLNCGRSDVVQQINAKSCHAGLKNHQSSLVTLLNLAVDSCGYETIYQLVDRSLLLTEDDVNHGATTVSLAQKYVDEPAYLGSEESDEESPSREVIVSFQW
ncbi:gamma-aminobutyric acid type B receptor subunit 2-like isoform X2 [Daphnia pulicaria]|uniref:gamma-aminobutyric acid type B receptor subunit 2-like isoform X2 n=1 Tax=Daphnia pulicaria TaxID=35523 RepID=UPI001EEA7627|nr:gamma-aminobutyric acid type B receptor subunit 2-like isoform X2 [Daphnia pulicaria]